jgi:hypothetical protein
MADMLTLPVPLVPAAPREQRTAAAPWYHDVWHVATLVTATAVSIIAAIWAYVHQTIVLYSDAHSHLAAARRVLDNIHPGIGQLGSVWLPLPHIIMLPLIWNHFLWQTGLAGTLTSMPCYIVTAGTIFLTIRRLTLDSRAGFTGALVFILNPNILYLQATPLSEPLLFAMLAVASYFFVLWAEAAKKRHLLLAAFFTMLATVARYDGWALYMAFLVLLVLISVIKRVPRGEMLLDLLLFGILGGMGIALWFLWNLVLFGDALYFAHGPFSSQKQTDAFIRSGLADTYHNVGHSLWTYIAAVGESIGPLIFMLGVVGLVVFMIRRRFSPTALAALTIVIPFPFYVFALYAGQDVLFVPHANHPPYYYLYNARFGAEMAAPAAVFIGTLLVDVLRRLPVAQIACVGVIALQQFLLASGGIVSLQDGQYGVSCYVGRPIAAYLAAHYNGGRMLIDEFHSEIDTSVVGMSFSDIIYEGDGNLWDQALRDPASIVDWIVTQPGDLITAKLNVNSVSFLTQYAPVMQESDHLVLWHRNGLPPLPNRSVPSDVVAPYQLCDTAKQIYAT